MTLFKMQRSKFWTQPLSWTNVLWSYPGYVTFLIRKPDFMPISHGDRREEKREKHLVTNINIS